MAYSVGVRDTGSPSTVTVLVRSSSTMPPMVMLPLPSSGRLPSWAYRRSWDRTRASTSTGTKGLVI